MENLGCDIRFPMAPNIILTAELDLPVSPGSTLRREHFPPERNLLPPHLTLFHRLSSAQTARLDVLELPAAAVPVLYDAPILLGFGVAVRIRSSGLDQVRATALETMGGEFSRQDSQAWRPHVTIQNKVPADAARRLHSEMERGFVRRAGAVTGLLVWEYLGGPWELVRKLPFDQMTSASSPRSELNF